MITVTVLHQHNSSNGITTIPITVKVIKKGTILRLYIQSIGCTKTIFDMINNEVVKSKNNFIRNLNTLYEIEKRLH